MARRSGQVVGMVAAIAALSLAGLAVASTPSQRALAHNRAAARRDAPALVKRVKLPAGAVVSATEPAGDHGFLKPLGVLVADSANATAHEWLTINASAASVTSYVSSHRPAGTVQYGTGGAGDGAGYNASSLLFSAHAIRHELEERYLNVTVAALKDGQTGILIEAQSDWVVPRPSSERVPRGVHEIDVVVRAAVPARTVLASHRYTNVTAISRTIKLTDSLPIAQPYTISCPDAIAEPTVTISFRSAAGEKPLAQASFSYYPKHPEQTGDECSAIGFAVHGHQRDNLVSTSFVRRFRSILGLNLPHRAS